MKIGEKQVAVYINVRDRANGKTKHLTVYGAGHAEVVSKIRKTFERGSGRKRQ